MTEFHPSIQEAERGREAERKPLAECARTLAAEMRRRSKGAGRDMTKDEIDDMWGHS